MCTQADITLTVQLQQWLGWTCIFLLFDGGNSKELIKGTVFENLEWPFLHYFKSSDNTKWCTIFNTKVSINGQ